MIRLKKFEFKKKPVRGKYKVLMDDFLQSKEKNAAWQCADKKEAHATAQGFQKEIRNRDLKNLMRVRIDSKALVVGLERVEY